MTIESRQPLLQTQSPIGAHAIVDGKNILNFGAAPYLGLAGNETILEAGKSALTDFGAAGQLPRHYNFACPANLDAEKAARDFFDTSGAMYIGTGYLVGPLVMTGLVADYDVALIDESAHYNLVEGARIAGKPVEVFKHCDAQDLATRLSRLTQQGLRPLVATDGMFSTYGNIPPLEQYQRILDPCDGWLLVDEAHSFGAVGATGRGACEYADVKGPRVVQGGSTAKSFAAHGGLIAADQGVIEKLWKTMIARGATSGCTAGAAMTAASLKYIREHPELHGRLQSNKNYLKTVLSDIGVNYAPNASPVATFSTGSAEAMQQVQKRLWVEGIFVIYSNYVGSGPDGAIRVAAFADHNESDFDRLAAALSTALQHQCT